MSHSLTNQIVRQCIPVTPINLPSAEHLIRVDADGKVKSYYNQSIVCEFVRDSKVLDNSIYLNQFNTTSKICTNKTTQWKVIRTIKDEIGERATPAKRAWGQRDRERRKAPSL
jgi:hypothetical protein